MPRTLTLVAGGGLLVVATIVWLAVSLVPTDAQRGRVDPVSAQDRGTLGGEGRGTAADVDTWRAAAVARSGTLRAQVREGGAAALNAALPGPTGQSVSGSNRVWQAAFARMLHVVDPQLRAGRLRTGYYDPYADVWLVMLWGPERTDGPIAARFAPGAALAGAVGEGAGLRWRGLMAAGETFPAAALAAQTRTALEAFEAGARVPEGMAPEAMLQLVDPLLALSGYGQGDRRDIARLAERLRTEGGKLSRQVAGLPARVIATLAPVYALGDRRPDLLLLGSPEDPGISVTLRVEPGADGLLGSGISVYRIDGSGMVGPDDLME